MRAIVLSLVVASSGCTVVFASVGGLTAASSNQTARVQQQPETASVGARVLLGALLGLVVDGLIIGEIMDGCCPDFGEGPLI